MSSRTAATSFVVAVAAALLVGRAAAAQLPDLPVIPELPQQLPAPSGEAPPAKPAPPKLPEANPIKPAIPLDEPAVPRKSPEKNPVKNAADGPTAITGPAVPLIVPEAKGATAVFTDSKDGGILQAGGKLKENGEEVDFAVATDFPGPERLFRRESETQVFERIRQEAKKKPGARPVIFPDYMPLTKERLQPRTFPLMVESVEPNYVCHGRLYFEQPNFERQGWDCSFFTPAINLGVFYYDIVTFPIHCLSRPGQCTDCSAGKCLPGDPTPLYLYHEPCILSGLLAR